MVKYCILIVNFILLINCRSSGQNNYELLYLDHNYDQILSEAQKKVTADDYYWLSLVLDKQNRVLDAISVLEEGITKFKGDQKLELLLSKLYYNVGNYYRSEPYLKKYQDNPDVFIQYINVLEFQSKYDLAIQLLQKRLQEDSLNVRYLSHLGDNYYHLDSIAYALKYYNEVFQQNPYDVLNARKLADLYLKDKDFDKSIGICDTVLKFDSTNTKFLKIKGIASFNKNDFKTAEDCFNNIVENGDSDKFALKHLGICEFNNSKFSISRAHLIRAFALDSNDYETCFFLGKAFLNSSTPERGLYFLNRTDSLLHPNPEFISAIYFDKQSIYSTIGNYNEAVKCYKFAYHYNPKPEYLFYIASMYQYKIADKRKALEYYNRFLASLPSKSDSEHKFKNGPIIVSLKKIAEDNIVKLKEELFFKGKESD